MIHDFGSADTPKALRADVCIIGSGVAGLILTQQLANTGHKILLLEGGGLKDEVSSQRLYRTDVVGLPHDGVHNGRFRVFGGSSTRWGGQLMTLRTSDFASHPHIPDSGWPLDPAVLKPYYRHAEAVMKVDDLPYDRALLQTLGVQSLPFSSDVFEYRFSKWAAFHHRNLAKTIGLDLRRLDNVEIVYHANAVELVPNHETGEIAHVRVKSLSGNEGQATARVYVVCCGAIDTARLLLASRSVTSVGVGNQSDVVGRYFQDHISVQVGQLLPRDRKQFCMTFDPIFHDSTMHSCKLELTDEVRRRERILNTMGHVVFGFTEESGLYELRRILRAMQAKKNPLPTPMGAWRLLRFSHDIVRMLIGQWFAKRRLSPMLATYNLHIECEQAPTADSRVMLSDQLDELGMPRAKLDWRLSEIEEFSVRRYMALFENEWQRLNLGRIEWRSDIREPGAIRSICQDTFHQAGTTRMSTDPTRGVVDTDLMVHGYRNLFIGGCSVFPTSGSSNPTFTMMALCFRLADHLRRILAPSVAGIPVSPKA